MSKIFEFVDKYKLWFAVGFLVLSIIPLFLPALSFVTIGKTDDINSCQYISFNFYSVFSIECRAIVLPTYNKILFSILQTLIYICIILLILFTSLKKQLAIEKYLSFMACICQILIFAILLYSYIRTCLDISKLQADYLYQCSPHISFYVLAILTIFSIIYLIAFIIKKPHPAPVNKRLTKQQQIDELRQQVKDLQDQIDKND